MLEVIHRNHFVEMSRLTGSHSKSAPPQTNPKSSTFDNIPEEVIQASKWWKSQVAKHDGVTANHAEKFFESLVTLLGGKIRDHWYPEEPLRGQAFRAISFDTMNEVDALLIKAATMAGINLRDCFPPKFEHIIMWIDPGEVVIKIYSDQRHAIEETVYERSYNSLNAKREQVYSLSALTQRLMAAQGNDEYDGFLAPPSALSVQS